MSEPSSQEPKEQQEESNPLDLSDLKSFSFGTEWTDAGEKLKAIEGLVQAGPLDRTDVRIGEKAEPASRPEIGGLKGVKVPPERGERGPVGVLLDRASGAINPVRVATVDSKAGKGGRNLTDPTRARCSRWVFILMTMASLPSLRL